MQFTSIYNGIGPNISFEDVRVDTRNSITSFHVTDPMNNGLLSITVLFTMGRKPMRIHFFSLGVQINICLNTKSWKWGFEWDHLPFFWLLCRIQPKKWEKSAICCWKIRQSVRKSEMWNHTSHWKSFACQDQKIIVYFISFFKNYRILNNRPHEFSALNSNTFMNISLFEPEIIGNQSSWIRGSIYRLTASDGKFE